MEEIMAFVIVNDTFDRVTHELLDSIPLDVYLDEDAADKKAQMLRKNPRTYGWNNETYSVKPVIFHA